MPGKRYYSQYANFTANVLKERIPRHPVTGDLMVDQKVPAVRAVFGDFGPEVDVPITTDPNTGEVTSSMKGAVIRGHYFDTGIAQQQNNWTDEEREAVERRLDFLCENIPEYCSHVEEQRAQAPWPTYDSMHHNSIAGFAAQAGMVEQAILYESQNKNRESVIQQLVEKQAEIADESVLTAA